MGKAEILSSRLLEVKKSFEDIKNSGINEELLVMYIQNKTKLSKKNIEKMLSSTKDFFDNLIKREVFDEI